MVSPNSIELLKSLDVGDSLVGRVARVLDDARVVMNFRGVELVATTTVPLSAGAQIEGIVQTKGPPLVLRITSRHLSEKSASSKHKGTSCNQPSKDTRNNRTGLGEATDRLARGSSFEPRNRF
jgi:hypothetical protein